MRKLSLTALFLALPFFSSGCMLTQLQEENQRLREEVDLLEAKIADLKERASRGQDPAALTPIRSFTVGLAASETSFDEQAFLRLLMNSLKSASQNQRYKVMPERDPHEVAKFRGMLVQQYLSAEEIPITVSNLNFKLAQATHDFKLGDRVVPRTDTQVLRGSTTGAAHVSFKGELSATMNRDVQGRYSIQYEELGGGQGRIPVPIEDYEILDPEEEPQFARQGDISFNWKLNLAKVIVYKVDNFQGDVGEFLRSMRFPGAASSISQYQTLRDSVFLFGYGNYTTSLINQMRTPADITTVEVLALDPVVFAQLEGGMTEKEILEIVGGGRNWVPCEFISFDGGERLWQRPAEVSLPFISRQVTETKMHTFYTKYSSEGADLIGDFERDSDISQ